MADRAALRKDVEELLASLENRPTSDIQLIWSWYGAGKTHTVYYLANQCGGRRLLPVYTELPREAKGFIDLYRMAVAQISTDSIVEAFLEFSTRPREKQVFGSTLDPDLVAALTQAAIHDKATKALLGQWLLGNALPRSSQRELGVGMRIDTTEKCAVVLADIVSLIAPRREGCGDQETTPVRLIWIVDEVQRVEDLPKSSRRSVLSGIVGVFNRCPTGLTMLLSYTGTPKEKSLPEWISDDLKDRIGLERPMLLPPLRSDEGMLLVRELLAHFRLPDAAHRGVFFPFEEPAIEALVRALGKEGDLKPRNIMETLDASLRALEPRMRSGELSTIGVGALKDSLARFPLDWSERAKKRQKG